jgi:hypothetical protein
VQLLRHGQCAPACNQMVTPFCCLFCKFIVIMPFLIKKKGGLIVFDENGQSFSNKFSPDDEMMKTPELLQFIDAS